MVKRKPGVAAAATFQEVRLPASTMLYSSEPANNAPDPRPWPEEFALSHAGAREAGSGMGDAELRVLQWKPSSALQLLRLGDESASSARQELLEEAQARGLDGTLLPGGCMVSLREPDEHLALIDDDKRDGLNQQLLTDMFTRMSLR
mmetsp:Transcript_17642/g.39943  ORF Transcript_17642/g.39943 Transcript_17642/m.39943 type:complete len:147 (-) Transcript_17642:193-633(-)